MYSKGAIILTARFPPIISRIVVMSIRYRPYVTIGNSFVPVFYVAELVCGYCQDFILIQNLKEPQREDDISTEGVCVGDVVILKVHSWDFCSSLF